MELKLFAISFAVLFAASVIAPAKSEDVKTGKTEIYHIGTGDGIQFVQFISV